MNVTNLEQVTFGVTDVETCRRFWSDFGLSEARQPAGSVFSCRDGSAVVVRRSDDPDLPPSIETGSTLRETTFGVRGVRDLEGIGAELAKDRDVTEDADGTLHAIDPLGFPIAFRVSRRMPAPAPELKFNTPVLAKHLAALVDAYKDNKSIDYGGRGNEAEGRFLERVGGRHARHRGRPPELRHRESRLPDAGGEAAAALVAEVAVVAFLAEEAGVEPAVGALGGVLQARHV